jgi:hypothetical protein
VYFHGQREFNARPFVAPAGLGTTMADDTEPAEPGGCTAVASYVATLSADLAVMARRSGLDTLGYLLEMVRLEAESATRENHGPNGRR